MKLLVFFGLLAVAHAESCGDDLSGTSGSFSSPNYPNDYGNNAHCRYKITVPNGLARVTFQDFTLETHSECSYDSVEVRDGSDAGPVLGTYCGTSGPGSVSATGSTIVVIFTSDGSVTHTGFNATFDVLTCAKMGGSCVSANSCDGEENNNDLCVNSQVCCMPVFDQRECGVVSPRAQLIGGKPRIVGGDQAEKHEWPWQVSLRTTSSSFHFCGGSIISPLWIVTAAHCVDGDTPSGLKIVSGEHDKTENSGTEEDHSVSKIIMHESYSGNGAGFPNDIALIKLNSNINLDSHRASICLAQQDDSFLEKTCYITGWGLTQGTGDDDVLNELSVDVWRQDTCINTWGSSNINAGHICVGTGLKGACNGDSGGPLACEMSRNQTNVWVLAGATSWGRTGCQTDGYPSVYSRISFFKDWIDRKTRAN